MFFYLAHLADNSTSVLRFRILEYARLKVSSVLFLRVNGFKKQTEILRQKHAEFLEKYKKPNSGEAK